MKLQRAIFRLDLLPNGKTFWNVMNQLLFHNLFQVQKYRSVIKYNFFNKLKATFETVKLLK